MKAMKVFTMFASLMFAVALPGHADALSKETVQALISKSDQAISKKDIAALASLISETAKISLSMPTASGRQVTNLSKAGYINSLRQIWPLASNYNYRRENLNISLENGKAIVSADVAESMVLHGQYMSSTSSETVTIELVDGKPLITRMEGEVSPRF